MEILAAKGFGFLKGFLKVFSKGRLSKFCMESCRLHYLRIKGLGRNATGSIRGLRGWLLQGSFRVL